MNRGGLPEILHCLNAAANSDNTEMSVLECQRSRQKWQPEEQLIHHHHHQQQQQQLFAYNFGENEQLMGGGFAAFNGDHGGLHELMMGGAMKPDPGIENGWEDEIVRVLNYGNGSELEKNFAIQRTFSCPPNVAPPEEAALSSATAGKESCKKRKAADKALNLKVVAEEKSSEKKMKGFVEEDSKMTEQNSNSKSSTTTATNSKGPSPKASEVPKPDYIHVRARRGQATDSHSLAERVRREKISERMKYLQDLVPGCNKITGKAGMLDEIINYVQSLQRQVEFLSMKLAAINPRLDFDVENYVTKQSFTACMSNVPVSATSSEMVNQAHLHFNSLLQGVSCSGLEMVANPMDVSLRRTISAPVSIPQAFLDSSNLNIQQIQHLTWEDELQNLYSMQ